MAVSGPAAAQETDREPSAGSAAAPDSPKAAVSAFLDLAGRGEYDRAARFLQAGAAEDPVRASRRLKAVFDYHGLPDVDLVSPLGEGEREDGLARGVDRVARMPEEGGTAPVYMVRVSDDEGTRWVFSRATVRRIDGWYERLPDRWLRELLPEPLLRPGPAGLLWIHWIALPFAVLAAWAAGRLLRWLSIGLLRAILSRRSGGWVATLRNVRLAGPVTAAWTLGLLYAALPFVALTRAGEASLHAGLRAGFLVLFFWTLVRAAVVAGEIALGTAWARSSSSAAGLVPLAVKTAKVIFFAIALVAAFSEFGYPVASLLAGLGIGGLALALALQKTGENLMGSVSLSADQPFRVGDFVRIEDIVGTVESIGFRSTRIRTLDRTVVSYPNGKLSEMRIETYAARDRARLHATIGLVYGTTAEQLRTVLAGFETVLRDHPHIWPENVIVRFKEFASSSLDVEVMAWFETTDWDLFRVYRQEVLLGFMRVVEEAGTSFAFPTRTVHLRPLPQSTPS